MLKGSIVALVTPFRDGKVDRKALYDLIEFHISSGTNGIVPCGTTGESATLTIEEHEAVIELVIEAVGERVPVIAGTGSNNTSEAVRLTKHAEKAGADAALLITPYYNRPTQEGLYRHFKKVAEETDIPILLYNVPGRTGVNMLPDTVARLAHVRNIIGIKEATGDLKQVSDIINHCPEGFIVLSGDDFTVLPLLAVGGHGVISVVANVVPADMAELCACFSSGDVKRARMLHYKMFNLTAAMFYETNPIPVKTALSLMGRISDEMRLPLCHMSEAHLLKLKNVMNEYGLIGGHE